jgi:C4-dicarboxylate-specific signal transduction histidine kinase
MVIGLTWSWSESRRARTEDVRRDTASLAAASAASFDQFLRGLDSSAAVLTRHPSVIALDRPACDRLFAEILRDQPLLLNILLTAPDETIKGSALPTDDVRPRQPMPHIQQVISTGQPVTSDLSVGPLTHKPTVILGYPVRSDLGAVVGVLAFGLDLSQLQSAFAGVPVPDGSVVTLTNPKGLVLARSRDADRYIGTTIEVSNASGQGLLPPHVGSDGVERFVASAGVARGGWLMSAGIPADVVAARLWPLGRRTLVVIAAATVVWLLVTFWMTRDLSRQIQQLREAARRMARGDSPRVTPAGSLNQDLAPLQESLVTTAEHLRQTRAELARQIKQERETREVLETSQRHLVRQERLAAVGLLLAGVAHELNNPLQAIMGGAELLERRSDLSAEAQEEVALVSTQSQRAAEIIRNLSRFGNQRPALPSAIDLRDVVAEVVQLRHTDLDAAGITCDIQTNSTGKVFASFTEIEQVVLNFVINAQQSIHSANVANGLIVIRSSDSGNCVRLEVIDNGPGVPPHEEAQLFQPFFTTKPVGEGTGLGLSVSHGIIDVSGGRIGYQRNEVGGATFYFELPCVQ